MSSDIVYTHIDALSSLSSDELKKYYDKIKPFRIWVPQWLSVGGNMSVEISPGEWKKFGSNYDEYKEFFETLNHDEKFYLVQKIPFDCIGDSYLYNNWRIIDEFDEEDQIFVQNRERYQLLQLFGLHTYGGYHGFFRPDLKEVIHLIHKQIPIQELEMIDRIYVTTQMHPSEKIYECYDSKADRHRACTTCYILKQ